LSNTAGVLPHSYDCGVLSREQIEQLVATKTPVVCVAGAGGVVAMRPLTVHASSKAIGSQRRRVLHIEYTAAVGFEDGITLDAAEMT
jgi:hypothetical protein